MSEITPMWAPALGLVLGAAFVWVGCYYTITPHAEIRMCLADGKVPRIVKNEFVCDNAALVANEESIRRTNQMNECSMHTVASVREETSCCKLLDEDTRKKQIESLHIICKRLFDGELNGELECKRGDTLLHSFAFAKNMLETADGGAP